VFAIVIITIPISYISGMQWISIINLFCGAFAKYIALSILIAFIAFFIVAVSLSRKEV